MKKSRSWRRVPALVAVAVAVAAWTPPSPAQVPATPPDHDTRNIRHKIADAYGVHSFHTVERVSFTFNGKSGEQGTRRTWMWWPQEGRVRYDGGTWNDGNPIEYRTADLEGQPSEDVVAADQRFINDSYWLAFPFHVEWDIAATVTDEGMAPLPIGEGTARKVVVAYPETGGYTPGDIYELYVSEDYRVLQWVFRPGGSETERYPRTWENELRFGNVSFATEHAGPDGDVRLWFTDIAVEFRNE